MKSIVHILSKNPDLCECKTRLRGFLSNKERVYLNCPYSEKDICKGAGGRWDPEAKRWYVPEGDNPNRFKRWLPKENKKKQPLLKIVE